MTVGRTDHTAFASAPPPATPHPDDVFLWPDGTYCTRAEAHEYMHMSDDVFLWPDGTYCTRAEAHEYMHMSDDYRVIHVNTFEWTEFYI